VHNPTCMLRVCGVATWSRALSCVELHFFDQKWASSVLFEETSTHSAVLSSYDVCESCLAGGMACDVDACKGYARLWAARFAATSKPSSSTSAASCKPSPFCTVELPPAFPSPTNLCAPAAAAAAAAASESHRHNGQNWQQRADNCSSHHIHHQQQRQQPQQPPPQQQQQQGLVYHCVPTSTWLAYICTLYDSLRPAPPEVSFLCFADIFLFLNCCILRESGGLSHDLTTLPQFGRCVVREGSGHSHNSGEHNSDERHHKGLAIPLEQVRTNSTKHILVPSVIDPLTPLTPFK